MPRSLNWQKSSYSSEGNNCIELAATPAAIHLRESDDPTTVLTTSVDRMAAFIAAVRGASHIPETD